MWQAAEAGDGRGSRSPTEAADPDAEFLLEDCDSDSGRPGCGRGRKRRSRGRRCELRKCVARKKQFHMLSRYGCFQNGLFSVLMREVSHLVPLVGFGCITILSRAANLW